MTHRVLLVGGGNQIAAYLIPRLLKQQCAVSVHSRRGPPPWLIPHGNLRWTVGGAHAERQTADTLIFLAPLNQFGELWRDVSQVSRVIAFSSTSAVGKAGSDDPAERSLAAALEQGEAHIQALTDAAGISLTLLRPTLIYGAGIDQNLSRLAAFLRRWRVMPLLGQGVGRRQPVHADDLAQAAAALTLGHRPTAGTYDLPGGSTLSYRQMVQRVFESLNLAPRFVPLPVAAARVALPLLKRTRRWQDLNLAMLNRMNQHLEYDSAPARRDFDYQPRPFQPQPDTWLPLDQRKGL